MLHSRSHNNFAVELGSKLRSLSLGSPLGPLFMFSMGVLSPRASDSQTGAPCSAKKKLPFDWTVWTWSGSLLFQGRLDPQRKKQKKKFHFGSWVLKGTGSRDFAGMFDCPDFCISTDCRVKACIKSLHCISLQKQFYLEEPVGIWDPLERRGFVITAVLRHGCCPPILCPGSSACQA